MSSTTPPSPKPQVAPQGAPSEDARIDKTFLRAPGEDDDGYDPYSDRPATPEPLFERDPWG